MNLPDIGSRWQLIKNLAPESLLAGFAVRAPIPKQEPRWKAVAWDTSKPLPELGKNHYNVAEDMYAMMDAASASKTSTNKYFIIQDQQGHVAGLIRQNEFKGEISSMHLVAGNGVKAKLTNNTLEIEDSREGKRAFVPADFHGGVTVTGPFKGLPATLGVSEKTSADKLSITLQRGNMELVLGEKTKKTDISVGDGWVASDYNWAHPTSIQIHAPKAMLSSFKIGEILPLSYDKNQMLEYESGEIQLTAGDNKIHLKSVRKYAKKGAYENKEYEAGLHTVTEKGEGVIPLFKNGVPAEQKALEGALKSAGALPISKGMER